MASIQMATPRLWREPVRVHLVLALVCSSFATACATVVYVPRLTPGEVNLAAYKRIAVAGVAGNGGNQMVDELTTALVGTQQYEVLDRKNIEAIMKEQNFAVSGLVSDETAVSVGNMTGAQALLVGNISLYEYSETLTHSDRECERNGKKTNCRDYTRRGSTAVQTTFKVMDAKTGTVLAAKTLDAKQERRATDTNKEPPPLNARDETLALCRKTVVEDFMKVIAPYTVNVAVELEDDSDLPELETGNNYAKLGNWSSALEQYTLAQQRVDRAPDTKPKVRSKVLYNTGIGLGYSGRYDDGLKELEKAFALNPDDDIKKEIDKIKQFKIDDARLAEQRRVASGS